MGSGVVKRVNITTRWVVAWLKRVNITTGCVAFLKSTDVTTVCTQTEAAPNRRSLFQINMHQRTQTIDRLSLADTNKHALSPPRKISVSFTNTQTRTAHSARALALTYAPTLYFAFVLSSLRGTLTTNIMRDVQRPPFMTVLD